MPQLGHRGHSLTLLARRCELSEPRHSCVFFEPSLRTDYRGEGNEAVGVGSRQMLAVELAEAFLPAEAVELGRDDRGGALVGGPGEL